MKPFFSALRPIVLASSSPRRRAFLEGVGLSFEVIPANGPEPRPFSGEDPCLYTERCAEAKARRVLESLRSRADGPAVLAADTAVVLSDEHGTSILGKPRSREEAAAMLSRLSGRTHRVVTACCLAVNGHAERFHDAAEVTFAPWPPSVLRAYALSGASLDKAGAYGIQDGGAFLVQSIHGSWSTVVGLPLDAVIRRMIDAGVIAPVSE